jgi:hypothetical protein
MRQALLFFCATLVITTSSTVIQWLEAIINITSTFFCLLYGLLLVKVRLLKLYFRGT